MNNIQSVTDAKRDILKSLRKHSYQANPQVRFFANRVINLSEARSIVRYHLDKVARKITTD